MATTVEHMPPEAAAALPQPSTQEGATQQPEPGAPPARDKPREPLSAGTVAGIAAALICALLTVLGIASVAAFNALRDDIGQVRAEVVELRTETQAEIEMLRDDMAVLEENLRSEMGTLRTELKADIEMLRAETREQFAEVHTTLRDHGERLARLETAHPHPTDR